MSKKKNKKTGMSSVLNMKCPRCHKGDLFHTPTWSFQKPFEMPKACTHCALNNFPEPGFYYGAMFISYILWGVVSIFFGAVSIIFLGMSVNQATLILIAFSAICFVWLFRISRSAWIHIAHGKAKRNTVNIG